MSDLHNLARDLQRLPDAQRDAARRAVNDVARMTQAAQVSAMRRIFDAITPYTARAVGLQLAQRGQPLHADVYIKSRQDVGSSTRPESFLGPNIEGGTRNLKRMEVAAQRAGVMPSGWFAVLGNGAPRDAYGNLPAAQVVRIMSFLRLFPASAARGARVNSSDRSRAAIRKGTRNRFGEEFFAILPGQGLRPGIWHRQLRSSSRSLHGPAATQPSCWLAFVPRAQYRRRYDFYGIAQRTVESEMPRALARVL